MPVKDLQSLVPGDVADEDVRSAQGAVLVKAGVALSDAHLRTLRMWGVESVRVRDTAADAGPAAPVAGGIGDCTAQAEDELRARFGPTLEDDVMAEIFRVAVALRAAELSVRGSA